MEVQCGETSTCGGIVVKLQFWKEIKKITGAKNSRDYSLFMVGATGFEPATS